MTRAAISSRIARLVWVFRSSQHQDDGPVQLLVGGV